MNLSQFKSVWEKEGKDPVKVIELFMQAVLEYEKDQEKGAYMISYLIPKDDCVENSDSPTGLVPNPRGAGYYLKQMLKDPNIVRSYVGGTPKNKYEIDEKNLKLKVVKKEIQGDRARIVIKSAGKDSPTPVKLRLEDGYWKIESGSISSIATGVKKPE